MSEEMQETRGHSTELIAEVAGVLLSIPYLPVASAMREAAKARAKTYDEVIWPTGEEIYEEWTTQQARAVLDLLALRLEPEAKI